MTSPYNIGDIVQLVSGGPKMTVAASATRETFCFWFSSDEKLQYAKFATGCLVKVA